ncbi:MAG TPA: hypothetical protein VGI61_00650 [Parafilimonas sp.]|jgi:hypothetical protein
MKIKLFAAVLIIFGCVTCTKNTYNTNPTLKFESVNATVFPQNTIVIFKLQCTDKEGDVVDTIWVKRVSKVSNCTYLDSANSFPIPDFDPPKNVKAEFQFTYNYPVDQTGQGGATLGACSDLGASLSDTCYFLFWMHDKAQHVSDTAQSPEIVLLKQ